MASKKSINKKTVPAGAKPNGINTVNTISFNTLKEDLLACGIELPDDSKAASVQEEKPDILEPRSVASTMAYLAGVPEKHFRRPNCTLLASKYDELENHKRAKALRCLCGIRTDIELNFKKINEKMAEGLVTYLSDGKGGIRKIIGQIPKAIKGIGPLLKSI